MKQRQTEYIEKVTKKHQIENLEQEVLELKAENKRLENKLLDFYSKFDAIQARLEEIKSRKVWGRRLA